MGIRTYTHTQAIAASTWNVTHNLGHPPVVDVWVDYQGEQQKILPRQIIHVNLNEMQIVFSVARTGQARMF